MKKTAKKIIHGTRRALFAKSEPVLHLYVPSNTSEAFNYKLATVLSRLEYFGIDKNYVKLINNIKSKNYIDRSLIGIVDQTTVNLKLFKLKNNELFNFDYDNYVIEGWEYHRLLHNINKKVVDEGIKKGRQLLQSVTNELKSKYKKAYIFGTGPSLEKAISRTWDDGITIVSNTIVKDEELWNHLKPNFIVAGDGIYHFGMGRFAINFRNDLKKRLTGSKTYFLIPDIFYPFCLKEFPDFADRIIPVPYGSLPNFSRDLNMDFELATVGNVLPLLLLPLACTLSKDVSFWGFDGRSPDAKLFWKNSDKHFYRSDVDQLKELHPGFFNTLVPKNAPETYIKNVHGDSLDRALAIAEKEGYKFSMLHFTYTDTLSKRYPANADFKTS